MDDIYLLLIALLIILIIIIVILFLRKNQNNDLRSAINSDLVNFTKLLNVNMNNMANRIDDMENKINRDLELSLIHI